MNKIPLNIVGLDGGVIIRKGGGGGATIKNQDKSLEIVENGSVSITPDVGYTGLGKVNVNVDVPTQEINNQEKSVDITENGVTEVTADSGFTGLSKVIVNTNVASSGGGAGSDMPVIGDGKTYLYITIAAEGRMDVPITYWQSIASGVSVDWGDGSPVESGGRASADVTLTHRYPSVGEYIITLTPADGVEMTIGNGSNSVLGINTAYRSMLRRVEIGRGVYTLRKAVFGSCSALTRVVIPEGVTTINDYAFSGCSALLSIDIPNSVTNIKERAFQSCSALTRVVIPEGVTVINSFLFYRCSALAKLVIPASVIEIKASAFYECMGMSYYDFSRHNVVPSVDATSFSYIPDDCKIIVPDALYDEWIAATNWSSRASNIIKKSDWDASQS